METEFERGKYLSVAKRTALAKQLRLTETQVIIYRFEILLTFILFLPFFANFIKSFLQIKIWFQNRRTKWKRKYTSDVETLASQYYAQIGIGGIARPMVVGDRLWLFSQSPNMSHPQTLLPSPNEASTAFRSFGANQPVSPPNPTMPMQSPRMPVFPNRMPPCNFLGTDSSVNYDFNKQETFYRQFLSTQTTPNKYNDNYFPPNQSKVLFNKLLWSNAFTNKPIDKPYERFPFEAFSNGYNESDAHSDTVSTKELGGIAELERAFGPSAEQRTSSLNTESKFSGKGDFSKLSKLNVMQDNSDCLSEENSDVDCEQL